MARLYWGFVHTYGANMRDENGDMIGGVNAFTSKAERDRWVEDGNDFVDQPGARTVAAAHSPAVRKAKADCMMYYRGKYVSRHGKHEALLAMFSVPRKDA